MTQTLELANRLKKIHLIYVSDRRPGIMRQKINRNFRYYDSAGKRVTLKKTLTRIKSLAIPPAWENVWICPAENGHLQATGYDEKGRKQYLYHQEWINLCKENKFNRMVSFGLTLPKIRNRVKKDLKLPGLPREKILATVIWLLEHTLIRVGNEEYAQDNKSFGLTTLRNRHVDVWGDKVRFEFVGKSGILHNVSINHPTIAKIIKNCAELPGYELFQYIDNNGKKYSIDSQDINDYLKKATGEDITAKDFRTWGATVLAAETLNKIGDGYGKQNKQNINRAVKTTSQHLRNTVSVCKNYYIHPAVFLAYQKRKLKKYFLKKRTVKTGNLHLQEYFVLRLLKNYTAF
ncbi:DNA topoisomerase IB [Candidatus Daviesbacteria bacterium]|nr:DNA topoisomerase IB [Candidatus Daviesbacteria bacterium]